ncbi:metal ABC transporter solute-binding protein, Zn/Mn family [Paenibacillus sp. CAU 1782]
MFKIRHYRHVATAAALSLLLLLAACSGNSNSGTNGGTPSVSPSNATGSEPVQETAAPAERLKVVTSFYPLYYLASEIGGEHVEVANLIAAGIEPHDWTPKSQDLVQVSQADLFLYHGAGLEVWIGDFLKGVSADSKAIIAEASAGIELISGQEDEHSHEEEGHDHEEDGHSHEEDEHGHSHDTDPHTWVSPKSALVLAANVKKSLAEADPDHAADYESGYALVKEKLESLDQAYEEGLATVSQKNLVVSHQAFGYLARDYGLNQISIMGLSPDAEPRAQDIAKIAKFVKENGVKYIFFEELVSDQLANMLANEAGVDTMVLNPLEGLTKEQEQAGETYIHLMNTNLQNLMKALQ